MNTESRMREMVRFNQLFAKVRKIDPSFSPHQYAFDNWDTREIFILSTVELEQLNAHMENIVREHIYGVTA